MNPYHIERLNISRQDYLTTAGALQQALDIVDLRRSGEYNGLMTPWESLNDVFGGGLEMGLNTFFCARPKMGKTAFATQLAVGLHLMNPDKPVIINYQNWEMAGFQQAMRMLSGHTAIPVRKLKDYKNPLEDSAYLALKEAAREMSDLNIFFFDVSSNVDQITDLCYELKNAYPDYYIVNMFDHTQLVTKKNERDQMEKLVNLFNAGNVVKKWGFHNIFLSQLGRELVKQIVENGYRAPTDADVFGSDTAFHTADSMILLHRPETYNVSMWDGWKMENGVRVQAKIPTKGLAWWELIKNREGDDGTLIMRAEMARNRFLDYHG